MTPTPPSSAPTFKCWARSSAYIGGFIENSERQREEADRWHTGRVETAGANGPNRIKSSESSQPHHMRTEGDPCRRGQVTDRKSTRLNSSHVKISYAVFC